MTSHFSTMQSSQCYSPITASKSRPPQSVSLVKLAANLFNSKHESEQSNKTRSDSTSPTTTKYDNLEQSSRQHKSQSSSSYSFTTSASATSANNLSQHRSPSSAPQIVAQTQHGHDRDRSQNVLAGDRAFANQAVLGQRVSRSRQEGKSTAWERIGQRRAKASGDWQL